MKVLLLGAGGQLGQTLCGTLPGVGQVVALDRRQADFAQPGRLAELVRHHAPAVVVNAAAYTAVDKAEAEPELAQRVNACAPAELAAAVAQTGAWLIHYSTDYVFDGEKASAYVEDDETNPLGVYGRSKRDGERAIAATGARHLIFRTSWVHGPTGNTFASKILALARTREALTVISDQIGAATSTDLIAEVTGRAISMIAGQAPPPQGLYHLASAGSGSWHDHACYIVEQAIAAGVALKVGPEGIAPVPSSAYATAAPRPRNSRLDTAKLRAAFGIEPPDWRQALHPTLEHLFRASGG